MDKSEIVSLTIHGNVKTTEFPEETNVCVKIHTVAMGDWKIITGESVFLSSFSYRGTENQLFIDLPFECALKSPNPFMWPRLVLNCFSRDSSGRDSVSGYGVLTVPTEPGKHICRIHCFLPESSSIMQGIIAKLRGVNAEFVDPLMPANADGRYACRTSARGYVDVEINVSIKSSDSGFRFSSAAVTERTANHTNVPSSIVDLAGAGSTGIGEIFNIAEEHDESAGGNN